MLAGILGFMVATAYWPGIASAASLPREAAVAVGVSLFLRLDPREVDWRMLCLLVLAAAWAISRSQTTGISVWFAVLVGVFIAGAGLRSLDGVMTGMAIGLGVSSAICIAQLAGWQGVLQNSVPAGLFFNREPLAELAAPVAVWWFLQVLRRIINRKVELLALGATLPLILCGERVAIFATTAGLVYYWHQSPGANSRRPIAEFAAELTGLALFAALMLEFFGPERWASALLRIDIWHLSLTAITPLGHGLGWFMKTYPDLAASHSDVLQMFVELGVGALLLLAIPIVCLVEKRGTNAERAILIVFCVEALVSFPLQLAANGFLAALVAGYLSGRRRPVHGLALTSRSPHPRRRGGCYHLGCCFRPDIPL